MKTTYEATQPHRTWAETANNLGFGSTDGFVDDATLLSAGFEEVIDILDDGELVLTQLKSTEQSSQAA